MTARSDWNSIKDDYRAGLVSIRAIAARYNVPESTIRSRAKQEGWQRDLAEEVKAATKNRVSRASSRSKSAHSESHTRDAEIVQSAADEAELIISEHRRSLARWRAISERLADTLNAMEITETNHDKVARSLNSGVDALLKTIRGERQAYGLDEEGREDEKKPVHELIDELRKAGQ
ncbi:hypothetical protein [Larsenimonas suaedae]|uniref:Terminase n=1 Tax=Larsenimonas suaedae TaxID=1851019 RepID=A0ABU1GUV5_9GAMM|nr:hypothetical protein [Larsenimonas suaedae]MCM2971804.1 hypothetical protein [Larsenimonas suaedae]MDR5895356.1 hypothetical protein [Larsenimonas suaedae]